MDVRYTSKFERSYKKLSPSLQHEVRDAIDVFRKNSRDSRLRLHKLKEKLNEFWAFSVAQKHRVVCTFEKDGSASLHDVGDHSIYQ